MGWNQPKNMRESNEATRPSPPRSSLPLLAAAIVVVGAVGAWWWVTSGNDAKPKAAKSKPSAKIAAVQPARSVAQAATNAPQQVAKGRKSPQERPVLTPEEAQAMLAERRAKGEVIRNLRMGADGKPRYRILFHNPAEREISRLLTHQPGAPMMGIVRYDAAFERQFMDSLKTPVEIVPEDTPREIELKNTVEETKKEILQRIKDGEKLKDILVESRKEIDRLARYRNDLVKMINEAKKNGDYSDGDFRDLVGAANKMLEENGMRPVSKSIFTTRAIQNMSNTKEVIR